ncbi:DUF4198 domain-containing protein [Xylophilus sp.]|uniref:DUF4198 domain-containing protein n=1 Tax=Xylophilus sp. TaxID=2653893 RepID=UPI0013B983BC|nr:DUF4198 domain-containing protein [Xylophilus sp.]KAF1048946.1 MAG: hypothetical protein GAK38_01061 [Xylophilus sp.]
MQLLARTRTALGAAAALLLGAVAPAQAHNVWLLPSSTVLSKAEWITVDAAVSNDIFFFNHVPLGLEGLAVTAPDGSSVAAENVHRGRLRSVFDLNLTQTGTYRVAVINGGLFASYKDKSGAPRRWRGTAERFAAEIPADAQDLNVTQSAGRIETFVTVGKPSALRPTGQGLELVPVTHPNDLVKGEKSTFALHIDGRPAAGLDVAIVAAGTRWRDKIGEIKATTDSAGQFSVTWPAAGYYWIDADAKDNKTSLPQARERRLSYSGTVEVLP